MLKNIALVLASTLMSLGLAEIVVRRHGSVKTYTEVNFGHYVSPFQAPSYPGPGPHNITTTEFSHISQLNSLGLRDEEIPPKSQNETRVLFLGDSFTYGVGVDTNQTWIAQLRPKVSKAFPEKNFRLINGGLPGWDAVEHLRFYRTSLASLDADLVVLVINSSDVNDIIQRGGVDRVDSAIRHPRSELFWQHSHFFRWVMMTLFRWDFNLNSPNENKRVLFWASEQVVKATEDLSQEVKGHGHRLVVILHPYPYEISEKSERGYFRKPFERSAVEVVDMFEDFQRLLDSKPRAEYSFINDGHFNLFGYTVFADVVWDYLGPILGSKVP